MRSGVEIAPNIAAAEDLIRQAAAEGAHLIATPEMTSGMDIRSGESASPPAREDQHAAALAFGKLAEELGVWLLVGSIAVALEDDPRKANRSLLISPDGDVAARYDKIHMFDVEVGDGQTYRESTAYRPGSQAIAAKTPLGTLGLTVCYDLRFPHLYRALAQAGAEIIAAPSAFTRVTGEAHWETLLRARAVETGAWMIAPAQGGVHEDGRETFGHSMIVSPWGEVVAEAPHREPCIITAEIDLAAVAEARRRIPSLRRNAEFDVAVTDTRG